MTENEIRIATALERIASALEQKVQLEVERNNLLRESNSQIYQDMTHRVEYNTTMLELIGAPLKDKENESGEQQ